MTWQEIVKQHKLDISIISRSEAATENRFDAEYYRPTFLEPYRNGLEVASIRDILTKCQYGLSLPMNEEGRGYPAYKMDNLNDALCDDKGLKSMEVSENELNTYSLQSDDVLFNRVNSIEFVGRTGIYKHESNKAVFASYLIRVITNKDKALPEYLTVFLNCKYGKKAILRKARRAVNQANVNAEELKAIILPLASMPFQEKIKNALNATFEKKQAARHALNEAEKKLLKAIGLSDYEAETENISIRSLAVAVSVSRFDAEYWQPKFDAILETIKQYQGGYDTLPNLVKVSNKKEKIDPDKTYSYVELADIDAATGSISNSTELKADELPSRARMRLKKNDVIVSTVEGSLDKVAFVQDEADNLLGSTGFFVFQEKDIRPEVLLVMLKSAPFQQMLKREAQGTILTAIPKTSLDRILLPKIDSGLQDTITELVRHSQTLHNEAKALLERSKRAVEVFIEKDEQTALRVIKEV